jgi:hypothetical protein
MSLKIVIGLGIAAISAMVVGVPAALADDTGLANIHVLRREGGKLCMADHFHYGNSGVQRSRATAERAAIRSWQDFTDLEYGSSWARFYRAGSKRVSCRPGSGGWNCDVEGRPCR